MEAVPGYFVLVVMAALNPREFREMPASEVSAVEENQRDEPEGEAGDSLTPQMTYGEFVHAVHQTCQKASVEAIKDLCKNVAEILRDSTKARDDVIKALLQGAAGEALSGAGKYKEPMPFTGTNPREWLMMMTQYYDLRKFDEGSRLQDAPLHLQGDAHMFYYTLKKKYPEKIPTTWAEFECLLITRFSCTSPVETLRKLMQIKYEGSVSEVTSRFAKICAEGDPVPEEKLVNAYLSRFPRSMIIKAMERDFKTWVEASEFVHATDKKWTMKMAEWYQLAPTEFKKEVESDVQCVREGWMLKPNQASTFKLQQGRKFPPNNSGQGFNKGNNPVGPAGQDGTDKRVANIKGNFLCHHCQGRGHRAKECPSRDLATRKQGSRCHRCGGTGHWAPACPTPKAVRLGGDSNSPAAVKAEKQVNGQA